MTDDLALVSAFFWAFRDAFHDAGVDYHVAVGVEDDGCVLGDHRYIDDSFSMSAASEAFEVMSDIFLTLGTYGANTERGFDLAVEALKEENTGVGGCNEGFLREHAALAVIHVSDEPEQSAVWSWSTYVEWLQALKADPAHVVVHASAGDYPSGCGSASPGTGYYQATVATGGLFVSACTDWYPEWLGSTVGTATAAQTMTRLAEASMFVHDTFSLQLEPVPETLEVAVDGVISEDWAWDADTGLVFFDTDHLPGPGSTVEITYRPARECVS